MVHNRRPALEVSDTAGVVSHDKVGIGIPVQTGDGGTRAPALPQLRSAIMTACVLTFPNDSTISKNPIKIVVYIFVIEYVAFFTAAEERRSM